MKFAILFALVAVASSSDNHSPNYSVKDDYAGLDFGHSQQHEGDLTQGNYYVLLPDSRIQRVEYTVNGDEGYVAQVTYEGEARYDDHKPSPAYHLAPSYKPAPYHPAPSYKAAPYHPTPAYKPTPYHQAPIYHS